MGTLLLSADAYRLKHASTRYRHTPAWFCHVYGVMTPNERKVLDRV